MISVFYSGNNLEKNYLKITYKIFISIREAKPRERLYISDLVNALPLHNLKNRQKHFPLNAWFSSLFIFL